LDACPYDAEDDADGDVICGDIDSCAYDGENDIDADAICGDIDSCAYDVENDIDSDAVCGDIDSCAFDVENDVDSDNICGNIDSCTHDGENDIDADAICGDIDSCAYDFENDVDSDTVCGDIDSCPFDVENDVDSDTFCGDVDSCAYDGENDSDSDLICGDIDTCAYDVENDVDSDTVCGDIDSCPYDGENDVDSDVICGNIDICAFDVENDVDSDVICGDIDSCMFDVENDVDSDIICGNLDSCPFDVENDVDSDIICSDIDSCTYDGENDIDSDAVCSDIDSCVHDGENDVDSDIICGDIDSCAFDVENDVDSDIICGNIDSCPFDVENDVDSDIICGDIDSCMYDGENDIDSDTVCAYIDSCAYGCSSSQDETSIILVDSTIDVPCVEAVANSALFETNLLAFLIEETGNLFVPCHINIVCNSLMYVSIQFGGIDCSKNRDLVFEDLTLLLDVSQYGALEFVLRVNESDMNLTRFRQHNRRLIEVNYQYEFTVVGYGVPLLTTTETDEDFDNSENSAVMEDTTENGTPVSWWQILIFVLVFILIIVILIVIIRCTHKRSSKRNDKKIHPYPLQFGSKVPVHSLETNDRHLDLQLFDFLHRLESAYITRKQDDLEKALTYVELGLSSLKLAISGTKSPNRKYIDYLYTRSRQCRWLIHAISSIAALNDFCDMYSISASSSLFSLTSPFAANVKKITVLIETARSLLQEHCDERLSAAIHRGEVLHRRFVAVSAAVELANARTHVYEKLYLQSMRNYQGTVEDTSQGIALDSITTHIDALMESDDVVLLAEGLHGCCVRQQQMTQKNIESVKQLQIRFMLLMSSPVFHVSIVGDEVLSVSDNRTAKLEKALNDKQDAALREWMMADIIPAAGKIDVDICLDAVHENHSLFVHMLNHPEMVPTAMYYLCMTMRYVVLLEKNVDDSIVNNNCADLTTCVTRCISLNLAPDNRAIIAAIKQIKALQVVDRASAVLRLPIFNEDLAAKVLLELDEMLLDGSDVVLNEKRQQLQAHVSHHKLLKMLLLEASSPHTNGIKHIRLINESTLQLAISELQIALNANGTPNHVAAVAVKAEAALNLARELRIAAAPQSSGAAEEIQQLTNVVSRNMISAMDPGGDGSSNIAESKETKESKEDESAPPACGPAPTAAPPAPYPEEADGSIEATQEALSAVIKNPRINEKLLNRPSFEFTHDVIVSVIQQTGYSSGLFEDSELDAKGFPDEAAKVAFLDKLISKINRDLGVQQNLDPQKLLAGQDAKNTRKFMHLLVIAAKRVGTGDESQPVKKKGPAPSAKAEAIESKNMGSLTSILDHFKPLRTRLVTLRRSVLASHQSNIFKAIEDNDDIRLHNSLRKAMIMGVGKSAVDHGQETLKYMHLRKRLKKAIDTNSAILLRRIKSEVEEEEETQFYMTGNKPLRQQYILSYQDGRDNNSADNVIDILVFRVQRLLEAHGTIAHLREEMLLPERDVFMLRMAADRAEKLITVMHTHDDQVESNLLQTFEQFKHHILWMQCQDDLLCKDKPGDPAFLSNVLDTVKHVNGFKEAQKRSRQIRIAIRDAEKLQQKLQQIENIVSDAMLVYNKGNVNILPKHAVCLAKAVYKASMVGLSTSTFKQAHQILMRIDKPATIAQAAVVALRKAVSVIQLAKSNPTAFSKSTAFSQSSSKYNASSPEILKDIENAITLGEAGLVRMDAEKPPMSSSASEFRVVLIDVLAQAHVLLCECKAENYLAKAICSARQTRKLHSLQEAIVNVTVVGSKQHVEGLGILRLGKNQILRTALDLSQELEAENVRSLKKVKVDTDLSSFLDTVVFNVLKKSKSVSSPVDTTKLREVIRHTMKLLKRGRGLDLPTQLLMRAEKAVMALSCLNFGPALMDACKSFNLNIIHKLLNYTEKNASHILTAKTNIHAVKSANALIDSLFKTTLVAKIAPNAKPFGSIMWDNNPQYMIEVNYLSKPQHSRFNGENGVKANARDKCNVSNLNRGNVIILARVKPVTKRELGKDAKSPRIALHVVENPPDASWTNLVTPNFRRVAGSSYRTDPCVQFKIQCQNDVHVRYNTTSVESHADESYPDLKRDHIMHKNGKSGVTCSKLFLVPSLQTQDAEDTLCEIELLSTHKLHVVPVTQKWVFRTTWNGHWDRFTAGGRRTKSGSLSYTSEGSSALELESSNLRNSELSGAASHGSLRRRNSKQTADTQQVNECDVTSPHVLVRWYSNPQLRLRVLGPNKDAYSRGQNTVTTCVVLRNASSLLPGLRTMYHVCRNESCATWNEKDSVAPNHERHIVVATSKGGYCSNNNVSSNRSDSQNHSDHIDGSDEDTLFRHNDRSIVCQMKQIQGRKPVFHSQEDTSIPETLTELPYFIVPSASKAGMTGKFSIDILSTGNLEVKEVTARQDFI
jgi:hypothetical protein